jgi:hypothetical protein
VWDFSFPWGIMRSTHATLLHEPQNTGVAFRYMSKLTRSAIKFTLFTTIPMGVPKNPALAGGIFPFHWELCASRMQLRCTNPRILGWRFADLARVLADFICCI